MLKKIWISLLALFCLSSAFTSVKANEPVPAYEVYIEDLAGLLSDQEQQQLKKEMEPLTQYGHVAFITCSQNFTTAQSYSESWSYSHFHNQSGVVFLIDMDNRMIIMSTTGDIEKIIGKNYCNTITDNIYMYASKQNYYACASKAFSQALTLMEGYKIAQPMKHINNGLLAIIVAILFNFVLLLLEGKRMKISNKELLKGVSSQLNISNLDVKYSHTAKTYSPVSSGSSSGGGGGGHSGGGSSRGGGGFSGSSGGHGF